ncbi:unnamed protein product [Protopolystoma xenopodis]|uniref:Uncharacterized protein n=1 Tax=Protopolystoma xenopodis TaxID=117903 RepID=A0A3S5CJA6_9PLAT|nr:unnamed protein product [Protopolystoma xenopodis]
MPIWRLVPLGPGPSTRLLFRRERSEPNSPQPHTPFPPLRSARLPYAISAPNSPVHHLPPISLTSQPSEMNRLAVNVLPMDSLKASPKLSEYLGKPRIIESCFKNVESDKKRRSKDINVPRMAHSILSSRSTLLQDGIVSSASDLAIEIPNHTISASEESLACSSISKSTSQRQPYSFLRCVDSVHAPESQTTCTSTPIHPTACLTESSSTISAFPRPALPHLKAKRRLNLGSSIDHSRLKSGYTSPNGSEHEVKSSQLYSPRQDTPNTDACRIGCSTSSSQSTLPMQSFHKQVGNPESSELSSSEVSFF